MRLLGFVVVLLAWTSSALACGGPLICTVKDPTGTPLHVRESAGGRILSTLRNGQKIEVVTHVKEKDQRWAQVAPINKGADSGWVFETYVLCRRSDADAEETEESAEICVVRDPTGTPLNVRKEPNGTVVGAFRDGERVRRYEEKLQDGQVWVQVARVPWDNALGYVFDAYLKCDED